MKNIVKVLAIILCAALAAALFTACRQNVQNEPAASQTDEPVVSIADDPAGEIRVGGWTAPESPEVTDEIREVVEKGTADLLGAQYTPIAFLGSQIVAGTNYSVLCKVSAVVPDPVETYAVVYLYKDLDGNVEVTDVIDSETATRISDLDGGWRDAESPVITGELADVFAKATEKLLGVDYEPVALLSNQLVAGMNYCFLAESTVVAPDAETGYCLVYIYADLEGNSEVTDVVNFGAQE